MYKLLAKFNKLLLPSLTKQKLDVTKANKRQKVLLAWRYFVTIRALNSDK
jgi:hypothetical protein